ncbi:TPA: chemotaxis protein [Streptococcus suis]|uniref:Chemotaxis protein n=1 Tax=Streptococcus suis TaxID=1307 RepID=A0A9X4RQ18_STRSU|nr:chemotaxis protein [Streptococcus parasuis]MDG4498872.1 chemotaxis protein [Streptococcus suis]MDG4512917.1 chemotaxis protein [Streptococcus suis]WFB91711.1 chemotaxis protein [Streptococcus parasuis]
MKLSNIIVAVGAASATFLAITNREKISKEVKETQQLLTDIQTSKSNIQHQLAIIQSFQKPLQELTADLQYKTRIYQQSIAGNLQEIQTIQEKYASKQPPKF